MHGLENLDLSPLNPVSQSIVQALIAALGQLQVQLHAVEERVGEAEGWLIELKVLTAPENAHCLVNRLELLERSVNGLQDSLAGIKLELDNRVPTIIPDQPSCPCNPSPNSVQNL